MKTVLWASHFLIISCLLDGTASAESPGLGLLYGQKETHSLSHSCVIRSVILECDFVQVAVRKKGMPSELNDALEKAREQFGKMTKNEMKRECEQSGDMASAFRKGVAPKGADAKKFREGLASMTHLQKVDTVKLLDTLDELCRSPSEENFLAIIRHTHDVDTRTCSVSSNAYHQSFKLIENSETWVVAQNSPEGPCGVVNVSRFEKDKSSIPGVFFWNYFAKKVVTNKSGDVFPGMACSDLDENEYEYNWQSKDAQLGCDYITFGAL